MPEKRRFTKQDEKSLVESIMVEQGRRENNRRDLEKVWDEVDRQVQEKPDLTFKQLGNGRPDPSKSWMPEVELPLQAAALEMTVADAQRLKFPRGSTWFMANAAMTDTYLERVDFQSLVAGDEMEVPSQINQDNANKLVQGWHEHNHRQYPFRERWSMLDCEAAKYGTFVGKFKMVKHSRFRTESGGVVKMDQFVPEMIPRSIRNVYLDNSKHNALMEGTSIGPSTHEVTWRSFEDLRMAALKGSKDPENENGGWRPEALKDIESHQKGTGKGEVKLIEVEGDHIIPRKSTRAMFVPNFIATIAVIGKEARLVRMRANQADEPTYFSHRYHIEDIHSPYGVGPLMKAAPIQQAATAAQTRLLAWAELNCLPPLSYDKDDPTFAQSGGPRVFPAAQWGTVAGQGVTPAQIGDGGALLQMYLNFLRQYEDLTGVTSPRLGERTNSHTTAFAKDAELQRGVIRIVDYVNGVLDGPMANWLQKEFRLAKKFRGKKTIFIQEYGGFVEIQSKHLPDLVSYEVFGAAGPAEEREKLVAQSNAVQAAMQVELFKIQSGLNDGQRLDVTEIQKQMLRQGFTDVDIFFTRPDQGGIAPDIGVQPAITSGADPVTSLLETG